MHPNSPPNITLKTAPSGRWTLRDKAPRRALYNVMRPKTKHWNQLWLLLATVSILACSPPPPPPPPHAITVPSPDSVSQITVSIKTGKQSQQLIQDQTVIERVLKLISENNSGWSRSQFTFPTPSASAVLSTANGSVPLVIWFGADWLGVASTVDGERSNYLWHVGPEVEFELRRLLEIKA